MDMFMLLTAVLLLGFLAFSMNLVGESQNKLNEEEKTYKDKIKKIKKLL